MAAARKVGFFILGLLLGGATGAAAGLGGGLAYITLSGTSSFEGYSGYVVGIWLLAGIIVGCIVGAVYGLRRSVR